MPKSVQRRDLSVEKIVAAALEVLRSSDPSALTMRRVAEHCGVSAMAIYHHVNDKDQLATLAVDKLFLDAANASLHSETWLDQAVELMNGVRVSLLQTPGAGMIFVKQAVVGPGTASITERMFGLLARGGLDGQSIAEAADAMTMLLIGSIANELTRPAQIREKLGTHVDSANAPLLHAHMQTYATRDGTERFQIAMRWLLDGAAQRAVAPKD